MKKKQTSSYAMIQVKKLETECVCHWIFFLMGAACTYFNTLKFLICDVSILKKVKDQFHNCINRDGIYAQPHQFFFLFSIDSAGCIFEQKTSDVTANIDEDGSRRGFTSAVMLASDQGLLCVTADQQFLFYSLECTEELLQLNLTKRLVGYNEEIVDMKFIGDDEKFLALATNLEQVWLYGDVHFYLEIRKLL